MMNVTIYSDGSSLGNPGPGGYGTRIEYVKDSGETVVREFSEGFPDTTNNKMELMGVITGLEALIRPCNVDIFTDSEYVVKAFNNGWIEGWIKNGWRNSSKKEVKNRDLWERLLKAMEPHQVKFHWVKGHNGNPGNERCDQLARQAAGKISH